MDMKCKSGEDQVCSQPPVGTLTACDGGDAYFLTTFDSFTTSAAL